jgi:hypothetical protein
MALIDALERRINKLEKITGSTFPNNPDTGQLFLHVVTGRKILYQYDGTNWKPIRSYGAMTLYVDATDGTDDLNHGTGVDADAFDTLQYAIDLLPPVLDGTVTIGVGSNITERVVAKQIYGGQVLIVGAFSTTNKVATGGTAGTVNSATCASITGTFSAHQYEGQLVRFTSGTNNGYYAVVGYTTITTMYLVGVVLPAAPANNDTYQVLDWSYTWSGSFSIFSQLGTNPTTYSNYSTYALILNDDSTSVQTAVLTALFAVLNIWWCKLTNTNGKCLYLVDSDDNSVVALNTCVVKPVSTTNLADAVAGIWRGQVDATCTKFIAVDSTHPARFCTALCMGAIYLTGCELSGNDNGLYASQNSLIQVNSGSTTKTFIHGCSGCGVLADKRGCCDVLNMLQFGTFLDGNADANDTDSYADASAYIV